MHNNVCILDVCFDCYNTTEEALLFHFPVIEGLVRSLEMLTGVTTSV